MLNTKKTAFTMIELVFVIVVLGILAAVAIPRFNATRVDAQISKGRADVASIRSSIISDRQVRLIQGDNTFIAAGDGAGQLDDGSLFGGVLTYGITAEDASGHWHTRASSDTNSSTVNYRVSNTDVSFTYTRGDGRFTCSKTAGTTQENIYCAQLID